MPGNVHAMARGSKPGKIAVGQLLRYRRLGSAATYRVAAVVGEHVVLEVRDAPGLAPGATLRVTRSAAAAMDLIGSAEADDADPTADAA